MIYLKLLLACVLAYLVGSISFSVIIGKIFANIDIRHKGSKNAGATNVARVISPLAGALNMICDMGKCVLVIILAQRVILKDSGIDSLVITMLIGVITMIGHCYPLFFHFKGGKAFACGAGLVLMCDARMFLVMILIAVILFIIYRMVSLLALFAAVAFPLYIIVLNIKADLLWIYVILSVAASTIIILRHRENFKRIVNGTEYKFEFKKKK